MNDFLARQNRSFFESHSFRSQLLTLFFIASHFLSHPFSIPVYIQDKTHYILDPYLADIYHLNMIEMAMHFWRLDRTTEYDAARL